MLRGDLVPAHVPWKWDTLLSLPVHLSTAMLLLDYAASGKPTPTSWPESMVPRLSPQARHDLEAMRVLLAHGAALRSFLLKWLPADDPAQRDWQAWRAWLQQFPIGDLIVHGILENLEFYRRSMSPLAEVERRLRACGPVTAASLADPTVRVAAYRAVLASWQAEEDTLELIEQPEKLREALLRFFTEVWDLGEQQKWQQRIQVIEEVSAVNLAHFQQEGQRLSPAEMVVRVTGLQLGAEWETALRQAQRVVFVPCFLLGRYFSLIPVDDVYYVLYEPSEGRVRPAPSLQVIELENLRPVVEALGDTTRLAILRLLAEEGELFALQIAEWLSLHQSTASRQLAQLEQAQLVLVRRQRGMKFYSVDRQRIQRFCHSLLTMFA